MTKKITPEDLFNICLRFAKKEQYGFNIISFGGGGSGANFTAYKSKGKKVEYQEQMDEFYKSFEGFVEVLNDYIKNNL